MLSRANSPLGSNSVDIYTKKIQSVLDMHRVNFGSLEDLPVFFNRLRGERHLAMDFWALTAAIDRNEGDLPPGEMLDLIVRSVTTKDAAEVRESSPELKQCVDDLARLLAGEDIDNPMSEGETGSPMPPEDAIPDTRSATPSPGEDEVFSADIPSGDESAEPLLSHRFGEVLLRLELNSLELKQHLDQIDSRINRLEPRLEELAANAAPLQEHTTPVLGAIAQSREDQPADEPLLTRTPSLRISDNARLVLRSDDESLDDDDDPSIRIPLEGYAKRSMSRSLVVFAVLLLVAGGVFLAQRRSGASSGASPLGRYRASLRSTLRQKYSYFSAEVRDLVGRHASGPTNATSTSNEQMNGSNPDADPMSSTAPASAAAMSGAHAETPAQSSPQDVTPPPAATNHPAEAPAPVSPPAGSAASDTSPREASPRVDAGVPRSDRGHHPVQLTSEVRDVTLPGYDPSVAPVVVPAAVMQENLMASRVPAYPEAAKADGVEGPVVMQAIISKDGTVGHLHVVQGDPLLRAAASEAVSKWHYRPYTVNGHPVEVATTVRVDFTLPRR